LIFLLRFEKGIKLTKIFQKRDENPDIWNGDHWENHIWYFDFENKSKNFVILSRWWLFDDDGVIF